MVITCFNFVIAHPIITPNSLIGKFMYTKADDSEGERVTMLLAATASCLPGTASQTSQLRGVAPTAQTEKPSLEVASPGRLPARGRAEIRTQISLPVQPDVRPVNRCKGCRPTHGHSVLLRLGSSSLHYPSFPN